MAHTTFASPRRTALSLALLPALFSHSLAADAQTAGPPPPPTAASTAASAATTLAPVTVTGRSPPSARVAGWGDVPLAEAPVQATVIDAAELRDAGARRLADLVRFDAAVNPAYDTEGYVDYFSVRGFVIDNRFNFRRDGLPINAETSIPLENKARVDILKGLSGMQVGTSAPGGLVDVIVKRPLAAPLRSAFVEWRERGTVSGAVDLSQRFGTDDAFGLRLNAGAERIAPQVRDARGHRNVAALAGDWRASGSTLVEAEIETSHRVQPSVPGFSLLGDRVPEVPNPRLNLNNQAWSQPIVFDATTASVRLTQALAPDWRVVAQAMTQHLTNDDRIAFPFGCTAADGTYYADRYCPDGTFDFSDFRSDGEKRRSTTYDLALHGKTVTGPLAHALTAGVQRNLVRNRFRQSASNPAGTGNVDGTAVTPPAPDLKVPNTNRDEHTTELYLRDAVSIGARTTAWLGARHTRLVRGSETTDGSTDPTSYRQTFSTPFAALSYAFLPGQIVYASWGRGVESDVAPTIGDGNDPPRPRYTNAGQALPAAKSRQVELGAKGGSGALEWAVAAFDIRRPLFDDIGVCGVDPSCTRGLVGSQRHRGAEASGAWRRGAWDLRAGAQWLRARVEAPDDPSIDGKRPPNVPTTTLRLQAGYAVPAVAGLSLLAGALHDSAREVLPDNSARIPGVTIFDVGSRYEARLGGTLWTLRAGIDNLFDKRAWREAPYQFSHAYLFPLPPRTLRLSLQVDL